MPFYEYECQACHRVTEVLQKMSDPPPEECPACGKTQQMRKLMSAAAFRLTGGGWYETDFKSDAEGKRNLASAEKEEAKPAAPESASGGDSKGGDAKTEAKPVAAEKPAATASSASSAPAPSKKPETAVPAKSAARSTSPSRKPAARAKPAAKPKPKAQARKP